MHVSACVVARKTICARCPPTRSASGASRERKLGTESTGCDPNGRCEHAGGGPETVCTSFDNIEVLGIMLIYALLQRCIGYFAVLPL